MISHLFSNSGKNKFENGLAPLFINIIGKFDANASINAVPAKSKAKIELL